MGKITLFGLGGSGTSTVGKLFAKKNDFLFGSGGDMFRELAQEKDMDISDFVKYCLDNNLDVDDLIDSRIKKYGKENDNFIFESRLAWYFIKDSLKIKLICDDDIRLRRIGDRDGDDFEIAKSKLEQREKVDQMRYQKLYGIKDYTDDKHFNLVIDTTNKTPEETVEIIEEEMGKKEDW